MHTIRRDEEGFSLIEVVVSFALLAMVLTGLAYGVTSAFASIGVAKQRQQATSLGNQLVEKVRAVPYASLGMSTTDLGTDTDITVVGSTSTFRGMPVVTNATPPAVAAPHVTTMVSGGITYTRKVYVTSSSATPNTLVVTITVSWPSTGAGQELVELSTLVSEYACTSQSTTQVCDPYWYSSADAPATTIRVTGTVNGATVDGTLTLDSHHADLTTEQYTNINASGTLPGLVVGTTTGGTSVNAVGDDSLSASGAATHQPASLSGSVAQTASSGGLIGSHPISTTLASAGGVVTTSAAGQVSTVGGGGNLPNDLLPYARGASAMGNQVSVLTVTLPSAEVVNLVRVTGTTTVTNTAIAERDAGANTAILDDDTVTATATRTVPTIDILDLPAAMKPAGWASPGRFARVTGGLLTVKATSGPSGNTPAPTANFIGNLAYWNATVITTRNYAAAPATIPVAYTRTVGACTITIGGSMVAGGTATTSTGTSGATSISATAETTSPLSGTLTYLYVCSGVTQVNLTVQVDLGRTYAEARYAEPGG